MVDRNQAHEGSGSGLDESQRRPWAQAEEEEEEVSRGSRARRDEGETGRPEYTMGKQPGSVPSSYRGDEGGDGM